MGEWAFGYFARNMRQLWGGKRMVWGLRPRFIAEDGEELAGPLRDRARVVGNPVVSVIQHLQQVDVLLHCLIFGSLCSLALSG